MQRSRVQKITIKILSQILAAVVFLASTPALSAIPFRNNFEQMDMINQRTKELNLDVFARIQIVLDQSRFNIAHYIPTSNLPKTDDGNLVMKQIFQQTVKTLLETEGSATAAGLKNIESLNSSLAASIDRNGHSVVFRLKAVEAKAEINYTGFVSATLGYDVQGSESSLEVSKNLGEQTYAYTHTDNNDGHKDIIGVRWNF